MSKDEYDAVIDGLREHLGELQRQARTAGIQSMIIFEGWDAAGKGVLMNQLLMALDPRGFKVYPINKPMDVEKVHPFFWRFWTKTPPNGDMSIFSKSWHGHLLEHVFEGKMDEKRAATRFEESNFFEKTLADDGYLMVKLFLHISKKEQKDRLEKLEKDPARSWMVSKSDWEQNKHYDDYLKAADELIARTETPYAPWAIVEANDRRFATVKIIKAVTAAMESRLAGNKPGTPPIRLEGGPIPDLLSKVDLSKSIPHDVYHQKLDALQENIMRLQYKIYNKGVPVAIVFEGPDAAGKGGCIKRLTECMDPRGYQVNPSGPPNDVEKTHHYLWRYWNNFPAEGNIAIFDRSWYGRVLVERVEGFCTPRDWMRAYEEINETERQLAEFGTVIVKFWLQVDMAEQLRRFEHRETDPFKTYKLTDEDWRNRDKWDKYTKAANEMFYRTDTAYAPWTIVEANDKLYARIKVIETVIAAMEKNVGNMQQKQIRG